MNHNIIFMEARILFVVNPVSGMKRHDRFPAYVKEVFRASQYKVEFTGFAGEAPHIVEQYKNRGFDTFVAVGGDGTVNEVARNLTGTNLNLGIVPVGSGNGLARHLKIPLTIRKALAVIKDGKTKLVDSGKIHGHSFFCTAGAGFDAKIGHEFAKAETRGLLNYAKAVGREFFSYKPNFYSIEVDGRKIEREAFLITFANASQYGNNAFIAPHADIADGLADLVVVSNFPKVRTPELGVKLFTRRINKSSYVEVFRGTQFKVISTAGRQYIHFDGEPATCNSSFEVMLEEKQLRVIC